jgi:hypothetical protein
MILVKEGLILLLLCAGGIVGQNGVLPTPASGHVMAAGQQQAEEKSSAALTPEEAEKIIASRAEQVITALKDVDMNKLGKLVHPKKGVRFSPYAYTEVKQDLVFKGKELEELMNSGKVYNWGTFDGTGDPIKLTFRDYYKLFVYDRDYANPEKKAYNELIMRGNTIVNIRDVYPDSIFVEYHFSSDIVAGEPNDMAWSSLRIIFELYKGEWYVSGISHDQWTI